MTPTPWREKYRVRLGAVAGILFIWRAQPANLIFLSSGLTLGFLGILLRQWAAGCLIKNNELATSGPYEIVRNPLYLGSFVTAAGLALAATSFPHPLILRYGYLDRSLFFWAILWIFIDSIYLPKIRKEEIFLKTKFGESFNLYASRVPALFPKLSGSLRPNFSTFNLSLWKKNEEVWSLIGFFLISLVMILRYHYAR